jgi:hypothetical protein
MVPSSALDTVKPSRLSLSSYTCRSASVVPEITAVSKPKSSEPKAATMALINRIPPPPLLRLVVVGISVAMGVCMFRVLVDCRHRAAIVAGRAKRSNTYAIGLLLLIALAASLRWPASARALGPRLALRSASARCPARPGAERTSPPEPPPWRLSTSYQRVVFFMRADPHPFDPVRHALSQSAVVIAHPHRKPFSAAMKLFEIERGMSGVLPPKLVVLCRQPLDRFRQ